MTPDQFLTHLQKKSPAPAYLFLGPEAYQRERCKQAVRERVLPPEEQEEGFTRLDLEELPLAAILDDARSLSLFARQRLLYIAGAEAVLPRGRAAGEETADSQEAAAQLAAYLQNPSPDTVLVFEASRFGFEGEDKAKSDRVRKFYAAVPQVVEFTPYTAAQARQLTQQLAQQAGLRLGGAELEFLVESVDRDASRLAVEIEKLSLYAGTGQGVTAEDLAALVPSARSTTIFKLVEALGRNDAVSALDTLDLLVRDGEYLPLALGFLATQFRFALAAKEANLHNAAQVQAHFSKFGIPMWRSRAEQIAQTMTVFSKEQLQAAIRKTFRADRALRDARPDDRVIMEEFVLTLP